MSAEQRTPSGAEHRAPGDTERRTASEAEHRTPGGQEAPGGHETHGGQEPPGRHETHGGQDAHGGHETHGGQDAHGGRETHGGQEAPGGQEPPRGHGSPEELTVRDPVSAPDAEGRPRRVTRRFPLFTKDTARPEGGGRAASGDAPAPARQWPVLAVLGLAGLGLLVTAFGQFRIGTLLIGVALLGGGAMRWLLPDVGMLAVRSRFTDIVTYGLLGTVIVLLALMAQPKPLLQIPFLKDTLHFTVTSE
ncbi:DUF3017 domain-containing protein [Streptomyces sp. AK010]|uniref:DUF3017 domain-containing protein n=1 Tax=Streptomyces sp. AK010 TaxID=2723074 RepID=UPI0017B84091|nr:DUF3017 domain-containing protein [Streptomyces sp. AK010]MBB6418725.1 hypothetical protein [Streptomyces sp. AK010]